jgi:hypothetical protein
LVDDEKRIKLFCTESVLTERIFFVSGGNLLLKITHLKLGQVGTTSRSKRQATICAELDGPGEYMTITICVPNSGSAMEDREYKSHERKSLQKVS